MEETLRTLVALAFTGLLVLLRLDADRFGAAEYAEADRYGEAASAGRRLAWYIVGLGLCATIWVANLDRTGVLYLRLGDRGPAILLGLLYGAAGIAQAVALARFRYHAQWPPVVASYPVAVLNSIGTALLDEMTFRGAVLGFLVLTGLDPGTAVVIQALLYALATRLGAPGRESYWLVLSILIGLISGWVTLLTGGIGAAFLGHAIGRFATFLVTGHAGPPAVHDGEAEDLDARPGPPEGWAIVGTTRARIRRDR
jgi:membrane protease YdiL (CAAX protease family)